VKSIACVYYYLLRFSYFLCSRYFSILVCIPACISKNRKVDVAQNIGLTVGRRVGVSSTVSIYNLSLQNAPNGWHHLTHKLFVNCLFAVVNPGIFFEGGVQQIQLRTEGRENRDLGW
jgi:hypothetical protein